jgi:hypothetical protein
MARLYPAAYGATRTFGAGARYSRAASPSSARAMTRRWISDVPS